MILIDSLYINGSGGLALLRYLIVTLQSKNIHFFLLADKRCNGVFDYLTNCQYIEASLYKRYFYYKQHKENFESVLCFGNIPPPIKLNIPVYTYFHNINLLTLNEARGYGYILSWAKRWVYRLLKENTDYWVVQTSNTEKELLIHLKEKKDKVLIMPFYNIDIVKRGNTGQHGNDYVFVANYTGAKGHDELLDAWAILKSRGIRGKLHLTIGGEHTHYLQKLEELNYCNNTIVNHGFVPYEDVVALYQSSKAIIYPSHNESLGLGIVEAIEAGCDVIASDLPFVHSICKPSVVFDPFSPESIADAIWRYEQGGCPKSVLKIRDQIDDLIDLLACNHIEINQK